MTDALRALAGRTLKLFTDRRTFGRWFRAASWRPWYAVLHAICGVVPQDEQAQALIRQVTGRSTCPVTPSQRVLILAGRGSGKSRMAAFIATVNAAARDYSAVLAPGERALVVVIAPDRRQARVVRGYVLGFLNEIPMFRQMIERETEAGVDLSNKVSVEVFTASFRTVRGPRIVCAVIEEACFLDDGGVSPDEEILAALQPSMARTPGSQLVIISSPYARRGAAYRLWREHYGRDDAGWLVVQADTRTLNPEFPQAEIDRAYSEDAAAAAAEYGARWREDIESFVSPETVDDCTVSGRTELPPIPGVTYEGVADPAGGSGGDEFAWSIGHTDSSGRLIVDCLGAVASPFDPATATARCAEAMKRYGVRTVYSDYYAAQWPVSSFREHRIDLRRVELSKSECYRVLLPRLNSETIELLDDTALRRQLISLERRTTRGGRESIDAPQGRPEDRANVIALLAARAERKKSSGPYVAWVTADDMHLARVKQGLAEPRNREERLAHMEFCRQQDIKNGLIRR